MLGLLTLGVSAKSPVTIMTTATEILQSIADDWAQSLGGKIPVTIRVSVYAGGLCPEKPYFTAEIGPLGHGWHAFEDDLQKAKDEAEHKWHLDGSPIEARDIEKAKLRAKAAELGLRIVEDQPERDEPVIYERGELAPADTRTEHDKSL